MKKVHIKIEGMMCDNCKGHVEHALNEVVKNAVVEVNVSAGYADVSGEWQDNETLKQAIEEEGYDVTSIDEA